MEPLIGQIILWAGRYIPVGWLECNGQTLNVQQYQPLYAVIGNAFGGEGQTSFALPDLRGRMPVGPSHGVAGDVIFIIAYEGIYPPQP